MASTYTLNSHSYSGRKMTLTCTQTQNVATNTSTINWTLTVSGGSSNYYTTGPTTVKINNVQVYYKAKVLASSEKFPAAKGSVSGSLTVQHDDEGNATIPVSIKTNIYTGVLKTSSGTWTLDTNPRGATLLSATNFTDEVGPTITYTNPLGAAVPSLQVGISLDGTSECVLPYRDIDKTAGTATITLTETDLTRLYATTPAEHSENNNSRTVWIYLRSRIGEEYFYSPLSKIFTITNPNPVITVSSIVDTNSKTIELTGDSSKLVKYHSNAKVTFSSSAVKGASLSSASVTCGTKSLSETGTIESVESGVFVFNARDSRDNITTTRYNRSLIDYIRPTCTIAHSMPDGSGNMILTATGVYFNGSFGEVSNNLAAYYRYKTSGDSYSSWHSMTVESTGNTYSANAELSGLDYQTSYTFQVYAVDKLETVYSSEKIMKATPVFDWGENDFKFNVPVFIGSKEIGKRCIVGQNGDNSENPWYKFASITASALTEDMRISFKVTYNYGSNTKFAILNAFARTANTVGANAFQGLQFESNTGLDTSNFVMAYSGTGVGAVYELWVKLTAYRFCMFEVLSESSRTAYTNKWTLYDQISLGYAAEPTSGYTLVNATCPYLLNSYPVGSYYISANDTSPASLFGGTWHRIESRFLWAAPATSTLGKTAGEEKHTLTVDELPSHRHDGLYYAGNNKGISLNSGTVNYELEWTSSAGKDAAEIYTGSTGGGAAHNNMPPYVNVAIWRREA